MSTKIKYWCNSGANAFSCRNGSITLEEAGLTEAAWDAMSEDERDDFVREIACERLDWGYTLEDAYREN